MSRGTPAGSGSLCPPGVFCSGQSGLPAQGWALKSVLLVLLAVPGALLAPGCVGKTGAERAIELFEKLGGKVHIDEKLPNRPVVMADLRNTAITDQQLNELKELPQLQVLILDSTGITDAGLGAIQGCSQLSRIYLRNTRVSAAGIQGLRKTFPRAEIVPSAKSAR
jgi:hypothetical protein